VIATFLRSTLLKLAVLENLSMRLRVFKTFLDGHFGPGKVVRLTRKDGVLFRLDGHTEITPAQLSSGELRRAANDGPCVRDSISR